MNQQGTAKRPLLFLAVGVVLLAVGFYMNFGTTGVSTADQARCEQNVRTIYGDDAQSQMALTPKCNEPGMVAMMDAKVNGSGAQEAARAISAANVGSLGGGLISYAVIGAGIGALGAAFLAARRKQGKK